MKGLLGFFCAGLLMAGIVLDVSASEELLIQSNTTIASTDLQHDGKRLIVDGATLTLSGSHAYESVLLRNSAVLTSPVEASINLRAGTVEVDATSRIDVSAKGKQGVAGTIYYAGGSYGGRGGNYSSYVSLEPYGDFREPRDLGSGGRNGSSSYTRGGGAFELQADTLKLDGLLQANGQTNTASYASGSGGSLLLRVGALSLGQQARIEANGGGSSTVYTYGGGGGGRVALYYGAVNQGSLVTQVLAKGGLSTHAQAGAAGSIYLKGTDNGTEELVFNNDGVPVTASLALLDLSSGASYGGKLSWNKVVGEIKGKVPFDPVVSSAVQLVVDNATLSLSGSHAYESVLLRNSAVLTSPVEASINLRAGTVEVDATSRIDVSAKGKQGVAGTIYYAGGSYGGRGGNYSSYVSLEPYGDFREPRDLGSGGRNGSSSYTRGGGAFELQADTLKLDGLLQANGQTNTASYASGSGGSLLLRVGALSLGQQARIEANGGGSSTVYTYGGGGGGRVALYYGAVNQGSLVTQVLAKGGLSTHAQAGAAGSIYLKGTDNGTEELVFNNDGVPVTASLALLDLSSGASYGGKLSWNKVIGELKGEILFDPALGNKTQLLLDSATLTLSGTHAYESVLLRNSAVLTSPVEMALNLSADTVDVDATSRIDVSGKGSLASLAVGYYCGGSHGGLGGSYNGGSVNPVFGDKLMPITFGIGGKSSSSAQTRGGGALSLVARVLQLDGQLLANGASGAAGGMIGGGAGGSLWVNAQHLIGSATTRIQAVGGNGLSSAGAGGGGRIAIYYAGLLDVDALSQISVASGSGSSAGGVGSLHLEHRIGSTAVLGTSLVDQINKDLQQFSLDFINAVSPSSINTDTIRLQGGAGVVPITSINAVNPTKYTVELGTALADGDYELRVSGIRSAQGRGMDQDGNGIEDEASDVFVRTFTIDRAPPPVPQVSAPAISPAVNELTVRKVSISGSREDQTAVLVNGVQQVPLGDGAWNIADFALPEGVGELQIQARDAAGNLSPAALVKFNVDSLKPAPAQYSHSGSIREVPSFVWVRFVEAGSGLDLANSSIVLKRSGSTLSGPLTLDTDVLRLTPSSPLLEGSYTYEVRLQDNFGNRWSGTNTFNLDYSVPAALVLNDYPSVTTSGKQRFSGSKEAGTTVRIRNIAGNVLVTIGGSTVWQYDLTLSPGDNLFTVDQTDAAGNVSPRTPFQIRFDNQAPGNVLLSADPRGNGTSVKLSWPTYDEVANGNDIKEYQVYSAAQAFTSIAGAQLLQKVPGGTKQVVIAGLTRNEERHYAVLAVDHQGLQQSDVTSLAVTPQDSLPPEEVGGLHVKPGADQLELSWQTSANSAADLSGYALYVGANGEQRIDLPLATLVNGLRYTLTGLAAAQAYPLRLVAVDADDNESAGIRNPGVTWLANPQGVELEPFANRFDVSWSAAEPAALLSGYRVYIADAPFNSVNGMTPRLSRSATQLSGSVAGLQNDQTYHVAVTAVNTSGGENPQVQSFTVKPQADAAGPQLTQLSWNSVAGTVDLLSGGELATLGELQLQASDESGISRIELSLDGQPLGQAIQSATGYRQPLDLVRISDGEHRLGLKLYDTLENLSETSVELDVALAEPAKPSLRLQSQAQTSNTAAQVLIVRGQANALAQVELNGDLLAGEFDLAGSGEVLLPVTLAEGENQLTARLRHANRSDFGDDSDPLSVTLDTTLPDAPQGLQAVGKTQGVVQLNWGAVTPNTAVGYNLYVANQPFTENSGASRINSSPIAAASYTHKPTADGTYYYRVVSVNKVGSESALSAQKSATADRVLPRVDSITYTSQGQVAADGRHAQGRVDVRVKVSEQLRNAPFLSLDVPEGASIPVRMTQAANDPLYYQGSFDITTSLPSGLLYARVSAYDNVGNEGTEIIEGKSLRIDTQGPDVQQLSLLPESPVENLVANNQGREVQVILRLSDEPTGMPQLAPQLNGQSVGSPLALTRDAQSQPGSPIYTGSFRLPSAAGQQQVDLLGFAYEAVDDLGNRSERIQGRRDFQVYQGTLPPLDIPQGLSGKAVSAGRVVLGWKPVAEASAYRILRRAEAEQGFSELARVREASFEDNLPVAAQADGVYFYQVASIREHEGKEAVSQSSEAVRVEVDSQASSAPRQLQAEMNGAGVVLRWQAPAEAGAYSYNLYRADVGQDVPITLAGRTALQSKIPELIALDSQPSDSEHAYTVTAVDAAGNESAPADTVYLNAGLLPVRDLKLVSHEGEPPLLQWDHSGQDVVGYNVYVGAEGSTQKLNSQLLQVKQYQDQGLTLPLTADRRYSITAVDAQGVESLPHALLLPALRAELRADQQLQRGLFNTLYYRVSNNSALELGRLRLRVSTEVNGEIKQHLSDYFEVAPGSLEEVSVVIGGYPELPGVVPLSSELIYAPQPGEEVLIQRRESLPAGENALLVQLLADDLTRGGAAQVRLRLENPSDVATELVTARANGSQASDEMRLVLEDLQGNVLASQPIKANLGNGLVTVRDGRTVLRVGALDTVETEPFSIAVPVAAPDQVRLRLEADYLHYQTGLPTEQKIRGLRSSREMTLVESPYYGELTQVAPQQLQAGDKVLLTGRALKREDDQPLANVDLKIVLTVRGFERVVSVTTDALGQFSYEHQTAVADSGNYQVSVVHPNIATRPQHGQFLIQGASVSPSSVSTQFPRNYEQLVTVVVDAGHDTALNNLRLEYVKPTGSSGLPVGIKVLASPPLNLAAQKRGNLTLRISGDNSAAASGLLDYRVVADGLSKPLGQTRIQYSLVEARPVINVSPNQIRTGLKRGGEEQVETVNLKNTGLDVLRNVRLSLHNSEGGALPEWVSLRSAERLSDLAVGAAVPLNIAFKPGDGVAEGNYYVTLRIQSDNHPQVDVAMEAAVTQSGQGGVIFQASDIYTGTRDDNGQLIPGLADAKIKLQNRNVLTEEYSVTTDNRGQALLENIPAGEYTYRVSAWDHEDLAGQLWIKPGMTQAEQVFLMSKLVTVEWSVKEITLEDRYEVILDATFKTNVPTALVMIEPLSINLPAMRKGDVLQGELTLTNYGLVRADDVTASLPAGDARAKIEYLRSVPNTLHAGDVVIIPYRIVALQSFDPDDELNGAAGCWSFNYQGVVSYASYCANGVRVSGRANVAWHSAGGGSCGVAGGAGSWGGLGR
ncbi:hypothetical protein LRS11_16045 [Pseudomonas sp. J452]|uniref:hypothetical protein n=1 Tax=Pseudomonas sp. J452 TaxID=2898441 RepID=UPI0021AD8F96|nr:hypothetical protein [Pseudomonas sp. J452]UUY07325.1 hypothetical protein LRS11_16045 [Pseudomonas sp. J452]